MGRATLCSIGKRWEKNGCMFPLPLLNAVLWSVPGARLAHPKTHEHHGPETLHIRCPLQQTFLSPLKTPETCTPNTFFTSEIFYTKFSWQQMPCIYTRKLEPKAFHTKKLIHQEFLAQKRFTVYTRNLYTRNIYTFMTRTRPRLDYNISGTWRAWLTNTSWTWPGHMTETGPGHDYLTWPECHMTETRPAA